MLVPRIYLHGTQSLEEYDSTKRKIVEARLEKCGIECLKEHPARLVALPEENQLFLPILDAHHRVRYSGGRFSINLVPCVIYTLEELRKVKKKV